MAEHVAGIIKKIINEKGLKQKSVAEKAGIPEKKFSSMLTGKATIKACYIPVIAKALDVTPNDLFGVKA